MIKLTVVIASTRPGRAGLPIGKWFIDFAQKDERFEVNLADLAELDLPFLDEPRHPRFQDYEHEHTRLWSQIASNADAFVFVTPEYNYGAPPSLLNALDFLAKEWHYKPVGFVSYGGVSAGTRSVQMTKQIVTSLRMMPLPEAVSIPFFSQFLKDGVFTPNTELEKGAQIMLDELNKWATALKPLHEAQPVAAD
jgi:NAD(P)H-dependent FMN reductase